MVRETTDRRTFVTLLYTLIDFDLGTVTVASAGHPPPIVYRGSTGEATFLEQSAPPLGTRLNARYGQSCSSFEVGDVLLLYTDGLTETLDHHDDPYGAERLEARFSSVAAQRTAREIRESILSDLWNHKGNSEQQDDITLVVVKRRDPGDDESKFEA